MEADCWVIGPEGFITVVYSREERMYCPSDDIPDVDVLFACPHQNLAFIANRRVRAIQINNRIYGNVLCNWEG